MADKGLGRIVSPTDPRDRLFLAKARYPGVQEEPEEERRQWYTSNTRHFDQGQVGQCTMYSAAHIVAAGPVTQRPYSYMEMAPPFNTVQGYCLAQELDKLEYGWDNPTFCQDAKSGDVGATMRSAAKVLQKFGFLKNYWWLEGLRETLVYLTNVGPVWMGTYWFSGMEEPDVHGYIHPRGHVLGGHAYVLDQVEWDKRYVWMLNSWGGAWGDGGRAKLSFDELGLLLSQDGEAIGFEEVRRTAAA